MNFFDDDFGLGDTPVRGGSKNTRYHYSNK